MASVWGRRLSPFLRQVAARGSTWVRAEGGRLPTGPLELVRYFCYALLAKAGPRAGARSGAGKPRAPLGEAVSVCGDGAALRADSLPKEHVRHACAVSTGELHEAHF